MIKVSRIEWLGGYRLRFRFNDESVGEYDFAKLVNEQSDESHILVATLPPGLAAIHTLRRSSSCPT